MTLHVDLVDLGLFRHVVEAGSITKGAERANLALAAASTRIRGMETSLGAALLVRGRQGVVTTPAGRAFLVHARKVLADVESMRTELAAFSGGQAGQVKVLSNTNALTEFLPEALSEFLALHPGVNVDIEERLSDEIVGLVAEGAADIGIVAGTVETGALETYPFRSDRFAVVVPLGHALADVPVADFAAVLGYDFVGLDRASALTRFLMGKAGRLGRPMRLRVQLRGFDAVCRLVEYGVGVGVVPETTARRLARTMRIVVVGLADAWAQRDLTLCVKDPEAMPVFARELVAHLRSGAPAEDVSGRS